MGCCVTSAAFWPPDNPTEQDQLIKYYSSYLFNIKTLKLKNTISVFYFPVKDAKCTVLYSHGNAENLATSKDEFINLAHTMKCNFCAYDYSGYGSSTGKCSEKGIFYSNNCHIPQPSHFF